MKIGRWWVGHPPYEELGRFADETLSPEARERVGLHLGACDRCRRELGTLHDAEAALRMVPVPTPPDDLFERILAQREDGGVLPLLPPDRPIRRPRRHAATAALTIVLAVVGSSLLLDPPDLGAGTSDLNVAWGSDRETVELRYEPTAELAGEDELLARAMIWTRDDREPGEWTPGEARLRPVGGSFVGELSVPLNLTYGLVSVGRTAGDYVDLNGGAYWEIPEPSVPPSADGYLGRFLALRALFHEEVWVGGGQLAGLAGEAAARYPDDPRVRYQEWFWTELASPPGPELAMLHAEHRRVLVALDSADVQRSVDEISALARWAAALDEPEIADRWRRELEDRAPGHPDLVVQHFWDALAESDPSTEAGAAAALDVFERGWGGSERAQAVVRDLVRQFLLEARAPVAPEVREAWLRRTYGGDLEQRVLTLSTALGDEQMGPWARSLAGPLMAGLASPPSSRRPFFQTVGDYRRTRMEWASFLRDDLARAHLAAGDSAAAVRELEDLLEVRWDPAAARLALDLLPEAAASGLEPGPSGVGDAGAFEIRDRLVRLLAIDPLEPADPQADPDRVVARDELLSLVGGGGPGRRVGSEDLRFDRLDGSARAVDPGGRAVLLLWSTVPPAALDTLDNPYRTLRRRLASDRIPMIIVGEPGAESELSRVAVRTGAEVLIDRGRTARHGFPVWESPAEIVLDNGRFWEARSPEDAARIALLLPPRPVVADE